MTGWTCANTDRCSMYRNIGFLCLLLQLWITPIHGVRYVYGFLQASTQFQHWYEQYGTVFETITRDNCAREYQDYLYGVTGNLTIDRLGGGDEASSITQPVILCILNHTSDYVKNQMSSAQVLLGLTPTILALLGPSSAELSLLTVVARRPFIALLLALACPSIYLSRAFEQSNPLDILNDRPGRISQWRFQGGKRWAFCLLQYAIIIGALSNVGTLYYQLGVRTVCMFWPNGTITVLVWGLLVWPIHVLSSFAFRLRARRTYSHENRNEPVRFGGLWPWLKYSGPRIREAWKTELVPAVSQEDMYIVTFDESIALIVVNWILTPSIVIHVIFGTLTLSSLTFIGPRDAVEVAGRFMFSVLVCRAVLMYEIAGIRDRYNSDEGGQVSSLHAVGEGETDDLIMKNGVSIAEYGRSMESIPVPEAHYYPVGGNVYFRK
ncbi:hypothetical protein SAMD00023353_4700430 [Rosellinia necatrix]|uniref:Uncharacterized protein n=1 Tax=Rosellinia necatrix TaxID=77044 RepID=A0A1W2TQP1_ROSNE|nr:hypothetical protein SAMD00023353_4700430 [Rosellinia necatrix]